MCNWNRGQSSMEKTYATKFDNSQTQLLRCKIWLMNLIHTNNASAFSSLILMHSFAFWPQKLNCAFFYFKIEIAHMHVRKWWKSVCVVVSMNSALLTVFHCISLYTNWPFVHVPWCNLDQGQYLWLGCVVIWQVVEDPW